ncbi:MAG TPA: NIPSNAP family protein [Acidimicrobiales bacterium]|jgi:hypothetical protein|nr:NIPSNAP family protein [Acidimicrobiales bacterium]
MRGQLRRYKIKPGQMEQFISAWRNGAVPVREQYGFAVLASWRLDDDAEFGWLVGYQGDGEFESAEKAYYSSPERAAITDDPAQYLDGAETWMVNTL